MALIKQTLPVALTKGIDSKSDPKQLALGELIALENATFISPRRLKKRNGYQALNAGVLDGTVITTACALIAYQQGLLLATRQSLYSYDQSFSGGAWANQGPLRTTGAINKGKIAVDSSYSTGAYDAAVHPSGLLVAAYERGPNGTAGVAYTVIDQSTGQTLLAPTMVSATAVSPKVIVLDNSILVFYVDNGVGTGVLYGFQIVVTSPTLRGSSVALTFGSGGVNTQMQGITAAQLYDVCNATDGSGANLVYLVFNNAIFGITILALPTNSPLVPSSTTFLPAVFAGSIGVFWDQFIRGPVLLYSRTSGGSGVAGLIFVAYSTSMAVLATGPLVLFAAPPAGAFIRNLTGVSISSSAVAFDVAWTVSDNTNFYNDVVYANTVTGAYAVGAQFVVARSLSVVGKIFQTATDVVIPCVFDNASAYAAQASAPQNTYFLIDFAGNQVARYAAGTAGGHYEIVNPTAPGAWSMLPQSTLFGASWVLPGISAYQTQILNGAALLLNGFYFFTFNPQPNYIARAIGANTALLGGAAISMSDGAGIPVEYWFAYSPWVLSLTQANGSIAPGTYQYAITYEWTDANGQTERSAPSIAKSVVVGASGAGQNTLTIPTLRVTAKIGTRGDVQIVIYRTIASGTTFFRVGSVVNNVAADSVTFVDGRPDDFLIGNQQLYTTGGVLENDTPPPSSIMVEHRGRVWLVDSTSPLSLWYSKQIVPTPGTTGGSPVEFSAFQILSASGEGGGVTALGSLDDKLIVFKRARIFVVTGQGPSSTGANNDFSDTIRVSVDVGCANQASITQTADGLLFQSAKGIYLLGRDLSVQYLGAPVESFNAQTVVGAQLVQNTNQVRFAMSGGSALVYDYLMRQWSVFTNHSAVDSAIWQGSYCFVSAAGIVSQETIGAFADPGAAYISIRALFGACSFAGVQGLERLYKMLLLGDCLSVCAVTVSLAFDFAPSFGQTDTFTPAIGLMQWAIRNRIQKISAIQIQIQDSGSTPGEGIDLSGLMFEVGIKKGTKQLPASNTVG